MVGSNKKKLNIKTTADLYTAIRKSTQVQFFIERFQFTDTIVNNIVESVELSDVKNNILIVAHDSGAKENSPAVMFVAIIKSFAEYEGMLTNMHLELYDLYDGIRYLVGKNHKSTLLSSQIQTLDSIHFYLTKSKIKLVFLVGQQGVGKTYLAGHVANSVYVDATAIVSLPRKEAEANLGQHLNSLASRTLVVDNADLLLEESLGKYDLSTQFVQAVQNMRRVVLVVNDESYSKIKNRLPSEIKPAQSLRLMESSSDEITRLMFALNKNWSMQAIKTSYKIARYKYKDLAMPGAILKVVNLKDSKFINSSDLSDLIEERQHHSKLLLKAVEDILDQMPTHDYVLRDLADFLRNNQIHHGNVKLHIFGPKGVGRADLVISLALQINNRQPLRIDLSKLRPLQVAERLEEINRLPDSVVYFENADSAGPSAMEMLRRILEIGELASFSGRKLNFEDSILVVSTSTDANEMTRRSDMGYDISRMPELFMKNILPSNLFHKNLMLKPLSKQQKLNLIQRQVDIARQSLKRHSMKVDISNEAIEYILKIDSDNNMGLDGMKRLVQLATEIAVARRQSKLIIVDENAVSKALDRYQKEL